MSESNKPTSQPPPAASPPPPASSTTTTGASSTNYSGQKISYPNPPDAVNPDAATLREQWRFAIRQYSKWYSHAWGTAILAGAAFFALGWVVKGSNPIPSFNKRDDDRKGDTNDSGSA